ncbi:MAG TPA: hypothetical protein VGN55_10600 [Xanthobacteraceae bacterium]|jgi:hypothetical protein
MSRYQDYEAPVSAGDWVMNTVRRNPEGLLLFAAGCALLMRSGASPLAKSFSAYPGTSERGRAESMRPSSLRDGVAQAAGGAADYVTDVKDRVVDTASSYADSVSEYAGNISDQSARMTRQAQSTLQTGMNRVLREQPLAVAIMGVAAGAAIAAAFPVSDIENQTFGGARDALTDAVSKAGDSLVGAAGAAGDRLKAAAEQRGLNQDGIKEIARDVAGSFTSAVTGKPEEPNRSANAQSGTSSQSTAPKNTQPQRTAQSSVGGGQSTGAKNQSGESRGGR